MDKSSIIAKLSPPLDSTLCDLLITEYVSLEKRYFLRDWEPATLDGGQFCEIACRCVYHIDSHNLSMTKGVDECLNYVEDDKNQNKHHFPSRKDALQLCRALRLTYKFRSSRGAVHIDPSYTANEMDAKLVTETVRWIMCELVRIFWTGNTTTAATVVKEVVTYRLPAIFRDGDAPLVQHTGLSTEDEILILPYDARSSGMTLAQLKRSIPKHRTTIQKGLTAIVRERLVISLAVKSWILTDRGRRTVETTLSDAMVN